MLNVACGGHDVDHAQDENANGHERRPRAPEEGDRRIRERTHDEDVKHVRDADLEEGPKDFPVR